MGNAQLSATAKRSSLSATLSRKSDRKMVSDIAAINQDTHRFSPDEMKWLHSWWFRLAERLFVVLRTARVVGYRGACARRIGRRRERLFFGDAFGVSGTSAAWTAI